MEYDEIDQYVDQLYRETDPGASNELLYSLMFTSDGHTRSKEDYWREYNSQTSIDTETSIRGLTCAEWIMVAAIVVGMLLFMMIKA
jgi:hypothetical protein